MPVAVCANTALGSEEEPSYGSKSPRGVTAALVRAVVAGPVPCEVYAAPITGSPDSTSAS